LKILAVGIIILMVGLAIAGSENEPDESIIYVEGIGLNGLPVTPDNEYPETIIDSASDVEIDWSDNLVFHMFPVGQKVRTEVILHDDDGIGPAVYTIRAHLIIQKIDALNGDPVGDPVYESSIAEGLFLTPDGKTPYYSAEINRDGLLLYGYNWDTRGLQHGFYRLTFWVEKDETCPDKNPLNEETIDYTNDVFITSHDLSDTDESGAAPIVGFVNNDYNNQKFWIDIELENKESGRN
jgi:hypothetical protein